MNFGDEFDYQQDDNYPSMEPDVPQFMRKRAREAAEQGADWHRRDAVKRQKTASQRGGARSKRRYARHRRRQYISRRGRRLYSRVTLGRAAVLCVLFLLLLAGILKAGNFLFRKSEKAGSGDAALFSDNRVNQGNKNDINVPQWVVQDLLPLNEYSRPGTRLETVNGVVVHYVGNPESTAEQNRNYYEALAVTHETKVSSHFVIGIDGTVIQCVPLDEVAYCSNNRNDDTISIECCHKDESGQFSRETLDSLVRLLDWLADTYGLHREQVIRHYDVTGKECPKYYVENPKEWQSLLDKITFSP